MTLGDQWFRDALEGLDKLMGRSSKAIPCRLGLDCGYLLPSPKKKPSKP